MPANRKYQPIWEALKKRGEVELVSPAPYHQSIKRMVSKEKDTDLGYKLELSNSFQTAKLIFSSKGNTLYIKLNKSVGLKDL